MSEEYDVDTKLTLDDKPARAALLRVASDFDDLYAHAVKTGAAMRAALGGMRLETKAYATTLGIAQARMNALAISTGKVAARTQPLATALERANERTVRLAANGKKAGDAMTQSFERAGRAGGAISSVVRSALGFASAYIGVQALDRGFRTLITDSFAFASATDKNRVSLGAVLAASDNFAGIADPAERMVKAGQVGDAVFRQLQGDALKSVATSQELASIYTGISGPLLGAGARLSEIRDITRDTVSAASVLGVDFEQASRDIMQMSTGAAGMDTKLFRMLRSTKAIKQSTEEWNAMLPQKRVAAMKEALAKFGPAGKAFEKTLPGITSSFVDFFQRFRGSFMAGPLELMRKTLVRLVGVFDTNQTKIIAVLTVLGNALARVFEPVVNAMGRVADYFLNNWEAIAQRIESGWQKLVRLGSIAAHYAPAALGGAKVAAGASLASRLAPGALSGGIGAVKAGLAGGPAAGAGALSTAISGITHLVSVIAAMGGTFTILVPIAAVLVGLFAVLADNWAHIVPILGIVSSFVISIFSSLWQLVVAIYGAVLPLLKIVGVVVGTLLALGAVIGFVFGRLVLAVFGGIMSVLTTMFEYIGKGFTWVYEHIVGIFTAILDYLGQTHADLLPKGKSSGGFLGDLRAQFDRAMSGFSAQEKTDSTLLGAAEQGGPDSRKTTINDFRGSKIEVKQDFRNANPDNVWLQMLDGVNSAAESRLSSALVPEFTR